MLKIRGEKGQYANATFEVNEDIYIGRDPSRCQIVLSNQGVSSCHCLLRKYGNGIQLVDLGSTNGTFMTNGMRLIPNQPVELHDGETFYIGNQENVFSAVISSRYPSPAVNHNTQEKPQNQSVVRKINDHDEYINESDHTEKKSSFDIHDSKTLIAIILVAVVILGGVWFFRRGSSGSGSSGQVASESPKSKEPVKISECGFLGTWGNDVNIDFGDEGANAVAGLVEYFVEGKTRLEVNHYQIKFMPDGAVTISMTGVKVNGTFTINDDGTEAYISYTNSDGDAEQSTAKLCDSYISLDGFSLYRE